MIRIRQGDARDELAKLDAESVHCCVTSPPYFGLRDYGTGQWAGGDAGCDHRKPNAETGHIAHSTLGGGKATNAAQIGGYRDACRCGATRIDQQIGLETSPDAYVAALVGVFREVRRVLRSDGTVFLNLGDSYWSSGQRQTGRNDTNRETPGGRGGSFRGGVRRAIGDIDFTSASLKPKDLIGIPWMVAFALRADGWWLRQDIIWSKPNPMPESVTDRCTKAHEYVFLLSKAERYFYDAAAIAEPVSATSLHRWKGGAERINPSRQGLSVGPGIGENTFGVGNMHNKRSVWEIATAPYAEAHFATFPPALIEPCILAGCPAGGLVLDPFAGAGTTGLVADRLQRDALLIELNPAYCAMARRRVIDDAPLFVDAAE